MSLSKDYDLKMDFPDGAIIKSRRNLSMGKDGIERVEEDVDVEGSFSATWVMGPAWMFELISLREGQISLIRDGEMVHPRAKRFALLLSMFSITHIYCDNAKYHWRGFGGTTPLAESWMNRSVIFDMETGECPNDAQELAELLRENPDAQSIEKVSRPSELSLKAKLMLDRTYNIEPSISSIAQILGVSHPHLTRQFKKDYGMTPNNYCHQLRASDAMARLSSGERIIDVSLDVGYNDLGRFYKQFRKLTRYSPGSCQNIMMGGANRNGDDEA